MRKLNKKGVALMAVEVAMLAFAVINIAISQLPAVKDKFRTRKATEKLVASGMSTAQAKATVAVWTKEQILDSIRDNIVLKPRANGGNFVGGYQQ